MLLLAQSKSLRIVTINLYIYYLSENWIILWTYINKNKFKFVHFSLMSYGRNTVGAEWRDFKRTTFIRIVSEERHTHLQLGLLSYRTLPCVSNSPDIHPLIFL